MMGKSDINRHVGEESFSIFPIDTYRHFMIQIVIFFSYVNIPYFRSKMTKTLKASSVLVKNCRHNLLTFHSIIPTFYAADVLTFLRI